MSCQVAAVWSGQGVSQCEHDRAAGVPRRKLRAPLHPGQRASRKHRRLVNFKHLHSNYLYMHGCIGVYFTCDIQLDVHVHVHVLRTVPVKHTEI